MQDFIPEGKEEVGVKSLFVDFVPDPTPEQVKAFDKARIDKQKAKAKKKEVVKLTDKQIAEFNAMEEETIREREINGEPPIESKIETEVENVNGAEPTTEPPIDAIEAEIPPEIQVIPETEILPTSSKPKNKRNGKRR